MRFAVAMCLLAVCGSHVSLAQTEQTTPPPVAAPSSTPPLNTGAPGAPASVPPATTQDTTAPTAVPAPGSTPGSTPAQAGAPVQNPVQVRGSGAGLDANQDQPPPDLQSSGIRLPRDFQIAYPTEIRDGQGSTYIPMDSWIYPALDRLRGLGYLHTSFLGLRPWTRLAVFHMLDRGSIPPSDDSEGNDEAKEIYNAVLEEVGPDLYFTGKHAELDTVYTRFLGIVKTPLNDSFHLGQTIINDYGRPFQSGINNVSGASGRVEAGRATLFVRAEFQHAPSAAGYSTALGTYLSEQIDDIPYSPTLPQATDPVGPIAGITNFRILEATLSYHLFKHEVSFGKSDHWLGPGQGGAFAWSNNADSIYQLQIDRVEPFYIPLLRRVIGPMRYDFFVGTLGGHTQPNHPWVHMEKVSIHPTANLELGFERTVIWGGLGHEPVTLHTFLRSFFSTAGTDVGSKFSIYDPGARFSAFDFSYRLPKLRNWLTLYTDSFSHDDVSPISAPRRAAIRPGLYLSHVPGFPKLDFRVEAASTDCVTSRCTGGNVSGRGQFYFYEAVQQQGTTNKGFLFTDPVGRDDKGGQAWLTYHLSAKDSVQLSYRNVKADKNFIPSTTSLDFTPGGTTQNSGKLDVLKYITPDVAVHLAGQVERWEAPIYMPGRHSDAAVWGEITWYPRKQKQF